MEKFTQAEARHIRGRYVEILKEIAEKRAVFNGMTKTGQAEWFPKLAIPAGVTAGLMNGRKLYLGSELAACNAVSFRQQFGISAEARGAKRQMELVIKQQAVTRYDDITNEFVAIRAQGRVRNTRLDNSPKLVI